MRIALIGYGKMGREIEQAAPERGHIVTRIIDIGNTGEITKANFSDVDVAIEFSVPGSAFENISKSTSR